MPDTVYKLSMADIKVEEEDKNMLLLPGVPETVYKLSMADIKEGEEMKTCVGVVGSARYCLQVEHGRHQGGRGR